ncbi:uncharacterized protein ACBT44_000133 [Syngnathus typhle]
MKQTLMALILLSVCTVDKTFCDLVGLGKNQDSEGDNTMDGVLKTEPKQGGSNLTLSQLRELAQDTESAVFIERKHKSFLEYEEIFTAIVAGGVSGAAFATLLAGLFIFKWHTWDSGSSTTGQQTNF